MRHPDRRRIATVGITILRTVLEVTKPDSITAVDVRIPPSFNYLHSKICAISLPQAFPGTVGAIIGGAHGGAAVAVASHAADVALVDDTVGDGRLPAGECGVVAYRPTAAGLPLDCAGGLVISPTLSVPCYMARTVGEVQAFVHGGGGGQHHTSSISSTLPQPASSSATSHNGVGGLDPAHTTTTTTTVSATTTTTTTTTSLPAPPSDSHPSSNPLNGVRIGVARAGPGGALAPAGSLFAGCDAAALSAIAGLLARLSAAGAVLVDVDVAGEGAVACALVDTILQYEAPAALALYLASQSATKPKPVVVIPPPSEGEEGGTDEAVAPPASNGNEVPVPRGPWPKPLDSVFPLSRLVAGLPDASVVKAMCLAQMGRGEAEAAAVAAAEKAAAAAATALAGGRRRSSAGTTTLLSAVAAATASTTTPFPTHQGAGSLGGRARVTHSQYIHAVGTARPGLRAAMATIMETHAVVAVLYPTAVGTAAKEEGALASSAAHGKPHVPQSICAGIARNSALASVLGWPAVCFPLLSTGGASSSTLGEAGVGGGVGARLPIGVEVLGLEGGDAELLALAGALQGLQVLLPNPIQLRSWAEGVSVPAAQQS